MTYGLTFILVSRTPALSGRMTIHSCLPILGVVEAKGRREVDDRVSLVDVFKVQRGSSRIDIGMEDLLPVRSDVPRRRMVSWQMSEVPLSRWWWGVLCRS